MSGSGAWSRAWRRAAEEPEAFWAEAAEAIDWERRWNRVLDREASPGGRWFVGGRLNTCHNALDRHVDAGHGDRTALVYDSAMRGVVERFSYRELRDATARFAGALAGLGVSAGDRVLLYMPMVPEAVVAMLACARIGAVHSVVFGGFAARELATRIDDATPKIVLWASCGLEPGRIVDYQPLLEEALEIAEHAPESCILLQRPEKPADPVAGRDHDWHAIAEAAAPVPCVPLEATHPLYVLYTSGTTGKPKGVVRDQGGHAVALRYSLDAVYAMKPGDVFWAASDIGWVVGHSYIVYAPLLAGCTTILYEGKPVGTPDAGAFWRVVADHGVNALFAAPTAFRAIKREDPEGKQIARYDLGSLRTLFLAGERADPDTIAWAERALDVPVIDHWWQTETGWPIAANCMGLEPLPVKHGSPTVPVPGYRLKVVDEAGAELPPGETGHIVVELPLPPGCLPTLWNDEAGFRSAYLETHPGFYQTADAGTVDDEGYVWILSRTDDIINVAGHRLSTGSMEEILAAHPDVAECAVVGVRDALKGQVPVGFAVLNAGVERDPETLCAELVARVRDELGPVAAFKQACVVERLPKTRSGKVLRGIMRRMADGEEYRFPATIEDPAVLPEIETALRTLGYPG